MLFIHQMFSHCVHYRHWKDWILAITLSSTMVLSIWLTYWVTMRCNRISVLGSTIFIVLTDSRHSQNYIFSGIVSLIEELSFWHVDWKQIEWGRTAVSIQYLEVCTSSQTLTVLNLEQNSIFGNGAQSFADALSNNRVREGLFAFLHPHPRFRHSHIFGFVATNSAMKRPPACVILCSSIQCDCTCSDVTQDRHHFRLVAWRTSVSWESYILWAWVQRFNWDIICSEIM